MAAAPLPFPAQLQHQLGWRKQFDTEALSTEIESFDTLLGGCPRGRITEIVGPASSGRTSLLHRILAMAATRREYCALVDVSNAFDPRSAADAGADLDALVWVRCANQLEHAMKSADLLLHSGGFGVVALDLCDAPAAWTRRIPLSWWYRFHRAVEQSQTILLILGREAHAKSCSSLLVAVEREAQPFAGTRKLLKCNRYKIVPRKPYRTQAAQGTFEALAHNA